MSLKITNIQAYQIVMDTRRKFEEKWKSLLQEENRLQSVFEKE